MDITDHFTFYGRTVRIHGKRLMGVSLVSLFVFSISSRPWADAHHGRGIRSPLHLACVSYTIKLSSWSIFDARFGKAPWWSIRQPYVWNLYEVTLDFVIFYVSLYIPAKRMQGCMELHLWYCSSESFPLHLHSFYSPDLFSSLDSTLAFSEICFSYWVEWMYPETRMKRGIKLGTHIKKT